MVTTAGWLYLFAGTVLFFFWVYGIVSFAFDLKRRYVPAVRSLLAARRGDGDRDREDDREERERQLY